MTGIQSPIAALFLQLNERGGLPPAKAGAAEPTGELESRVCVGKLHPLCKGWVSTLDLI